MNWDLPNFFIGLLAVLLLVAVLGDIKSRTIPNWLNGLIALLALPYWWTAGLLLWPDIAVHFAVAAAVFGLFALAFMAGMMGGGDVKLLAALALWLPPGAVLKLLVIMSIAGGVLTIVMWLRHRLAKAEHQLEVPYGVAIAFAGFWLIGERFLNQFG
jgi:prepilin peptidase CpaA